VLTTRLVEFIVGVTDVPDEVLDRSENAFIDTVGGALVGVDDPATQIATRWIEGTTSASRATIWGSAVRASAADAALVNGVAAHVLDWDDTSPSLRGHPSATLIPTVMAVGEATAASGRDVLGAYAVGVDVAGKIARALGNAHYIRGWHNTVTVGVFSCTAAAGRLMGLDADQMANALGIAASQSAGLLRNFGTMTKPLHVGLAARVGIQAAELAKLGFTADTTILDGPDGFIGIYGGADGQPLEGLLDSLGAPWEVVKPGIAAKKWPCCYQVHRALIGLGDLVKEHHIDPATISAIDIGFAPGSDAALIYDDPQTGLEAKFSAQYNIAAYLIDGTLGMATYEDASIHRPDVRALMGRISRYTVPDTRSYSGTIGYTDVRIVTNGQTYEHRVQQEETRHAWVVSDAEHDEKFLACVTYVMAADAAQGLLADARSIRDLDDVSGLARSLSMVGAG
jgi:2-methylcitrate dehydratase PrpD